MKDYVRERRLRSREMFVPLHHPAGHAQADFGEAMAVKVHFLAFDLPHSDACFVKAYPAETTEAFCDGHNAAVAFFGGVPRSILYDNTKLAVARILGDGKRQRTRVFTELQSHYPFEDRFGRPGKGNDKGKVEGLVGFIRRNFLVPVPRVESIEALNDDLAGQSASGYTGFPRGASPPAFLIKLPISGPLMTFPPAAGYRRVVRVGRDQAQPVRPGLARGLEHFPIILGHILS